MQYKINNKTVENSPAYLTAIVLAFICKKNKNINLKARIVERNKKCEQNAENETLFSRREKIKYTPLVFHTCCCGAFHGQAQA